MRVFMTTMLGLAVAAVFAAPGAAPSPAQSLDPPVLLQPTSGQSFAARTPIAFRVRSHPGDEYLWLYVSRSPTVVNACGTIAHDASIWDFTATSDPSVYEAKPTYYSYDSFWMNTPGTYYWQAHRIEYAGGADGCIESEVRPFTVKGAPAPAPSPKPSPVPEPTPKPLSQARLAGQFDVVTRVTSVSGIGVKVGSKDTGTWTFTPQCAAGACSVKLRYSYRGASFDAHTIRVRLTKTGATYRGSARTPLVECSFKDVYGPLTVQLKVVAGSWVDGRWRATRIRGSFRYEAPSTTAGIYRCPAAKLTSAVNGTLAR